MAKRNKKIDCFFVTPIGETGSDVRKRADTILEHVLRPISADFLNIVRADEVDDPGTITTDIVQRLHSNPLVIADLTGHNPNVMYEVGLRHCFNLPIVHIAQTGERPPFDLAAERIVFFDIHDLSSVEDGKKRILSACRSAVSAKPFRSPVVRALEKETLFAGTDGNPVVADIGERLDAIETALENTVSNIHDTYYDMLHDAIGHFSNYDDSVTTILEEFSDALSMLNRNDMFALAKAAKEMLKAQKAK